MLKLIWEWLIMISVLILPGFVTFAVLWLIQNRDDDWNIF